MRIPVSSSTALRTIFKIPLPDVGKVTDLGVDDWAFRKGLVYGTILVDLKKGTVIDLLADRETEGFENWIMDHAEIQYVSRDRSTNYSSAIANSGREIVEVADRFHLIKNMSDCITKVISDNYSDYRNLIRPDEVLTVQEDENITSEGFQRISPTPEDKSDARTNMFNEVKELQNKGLKINAIAKKLNIARQTVRKYMNYDSLPERRSGVRNNYYKYDKYVEEEYSKGKSLNVIYNEILIKGFKGSQTPFYDHYKYLIHTRIKSTGKKKKIEDHREPLVPVKAISAIIFKNIHGYNLENEDKELIKKLTELKWFKSLYKAAESFCKIIMGNNAESLKVWIEEYKNTTIPKLKTFITGIIIDLKAVKNSIIYQLSNGIVEGFVNKLKTIKRMMYGRAGLELLKRKMIFTNRGFQLN